MEHSSPATAQTARSRVDRAIAARFTEMLRQGVDVRRRKARRTRAAIRLRSYENDLKLEIAIERLLDEVAPPTVGSLK